MFCIMNHKLLWQPLIIVGCLLCRWVSGRQWFMGRQRTSWSWQNRPVSTWTLTCHLALPQGPLCFKAVPSLRRQHYYTRPTTETSTESCKRQSSEDKFISFSFEAEVHCQGRPQKRTAAGTVFNTFLGHCPSSFSFVGLACIFLWIHTTWQHKQLCTDMKRLEFFSVLVSYVETTCTYSRL